MPDTTSKAASNDRKSIALTVSIIVAILGSWVGVAGLTAAVVQKQAQTTILAVAVEAKADARIALEKIQAPTFGLESRVMKVETVQAAVLSTLTEIRVDVKKLLAERR